MNGQFLVARMRRKLAAIKRKVLYINYGLPEIDLPSIVPHELTILDPIMEDICLPPFHGPQDHDDYAPLMKIVRSLTPKIVLEFGTAYGNTVANICRHSPETTVYTVNAPAKEQTGGVVTFELSRDEIGRVYRAHGLAAQAVQIFCNTLEFDASQYFPRPIVDLAIVDACHDTKYVLNDFNKVLPILAPGGMVLLHDTHPSMAGHLAGSYMACMYLRMRGYDVRHIRNTWWAVWKKQWCGSG